MLHKILRDLEFETNLKTYLEIASIRFTKISTLFDYSLSIISAIDCVSKLYLTRPSLASVCNRSLIQRLVTVLMEFQKVSYKTHDILIKILCDKRWNISASLCI